MLTILQVAIGISFGFLLFSVIVSSANEIGQALASTRSKQSSASRHSSKCVIADSGDGAYAAGWLTRCFAVPRLLSPTECAESS